MEEAENRGFRFTVSGFRLTMNYSTKQRSGDGQNMLPDGKKKRVRTGNRKPETISIDIQLLTSFVKFLFPLLPFPFHPVIEHPAHIPHHCTEQRNHHAENSIFLGSFDEHENGSS